MLKTSKFFGIITPRKELHPKFWARIYAYILFLDSTVDGPSFARRRYWL